MSSLKVSGEVALYRLAWALSNKRSFLSGLPLGHLANIPLWYSCFAHVLSKAKNKYPHFKLYLGNIYLLTPAEHHIYDQGTQEARIKYSQDVKTADWSQLEAKEEELKVKYYEVFPIRKDGMIMKYTPREVEDAIQILNQEFFEAIKKGPRTKRKPLLKLPGIIKL